MPESDLRQAAIVLMSLPEQQAAEIMSQLAPHQIQAVSIEIACIEQIGGDEQSEAIRRFAESSPSSLGGESGGMNRAKNLIKNALGDKASEYIDNVRQHVEALPFGFLHKVDSQNLLTFIIDEHPQTIALILSYLPSSLAADILTGLSTERRESVVRRIATMGESNPDVIAEVEQGLKNRMSSALSQQFQNAGGVKSVAEILNVTERSTERAIMESLAEDDPELVEEIRRLMFVFDDITKLSNGDVQTIMKNVDTNQWAMALKGASEELKQTVLGNMSSRAAQLLTEEMEYLGVVRLAEVEQIQQKIVDIIRHLEDAGEITVHGDPSKEQMIQ